jgi:aldose sugar dehydrogenase
MKILICTILLLNLVMFQNSQSQAIETNVIATGLDTPWEILWGPDDFIWTTERPGIVSRIDPESGDKFEILDITDIVHEESESGLMGMVLHPNFSTTPHVFIVYTIREQGVEAKIVRYTYDGEKLVDPLTIFENVPGNSTHDGARLLIDDDMTLYFTMGDARLENPPVHAQRLDNPNGKTLRMNLDGSVPEDNPFVDIDGANPYIWTYGHRNQQGIVKANGIMYTGEHGASTADELNILEKGRNYGWPYVEGFCNTDLEITFCEENNIVEPIGEYYANYTLALAGIDYYPNDFILESAPIDEWRNSILMVGLAKARLVSAKLSEDGLSVVEEKTYFDNEFGRLRDLCVSPDMRVFIATSNFDNRGKEPFASDPDKDKIIEIRSTFYSIESDQEINPLKFSSENSVLIIDSDHFGKYLEIYNLLGEIIVKEKIRSNNFNVNKLDSGIYIAKLKNHSLKFIIR